MSCGIGHRHGTGPILLWLWCRLAATAPAWELSFVVGTYPPKKKKKKPIWVLIIMCYGHIPLTPLSLPLLIWSTLHTTLSISDQGQLSTVCYCHVQILAVLNRTERENRAY